MKFFSKIIHSNLKCIRLNFFKGFTLAEVLITLGVIGVVAAITIPVVQQNLQKKALETQVKKFVSDLERGMKQILINNNCLSLECTGIFNDYGTTDFTDRIVKEMKAAFTDVDYCTASCDYDFPIEKKIGGNSLLGWGETKGTETNPLFRLGNGAFFQFKGNITSAKPDTTSKYKSQVSFFVDMNGHKPPNTYGKDIHWGHIAGTGQFFADYGKDYCEMNYTVPYQSCTEYWKNNGSCNPSVPSSTGDGCLARIMENSWVFDFW